MESELVPVTNGNLLLSGRVAVPVVVARAGDRASERFLEFFTATIRNKNTRAAYAHAVSQFFLWCESNGFALETLRPVVVATYIELLQGSHSAPTVKQHLAAIRMLFDWLVTGQVIAMNPAASVRGPKYVVKKGKTPVLSAEEARRLLDSIDTSTLTGLRDRALIAVMVYSFARVSAVVNMDVADYWQNGKRWWLRLHEKGGKFHEVPTHHNAEEYLDAYIHTAGIGTDCKSPLFRTSRGRTGALTANRMSRKDAWHMIKRRVRAAGLSSRVNCHTWRATGITAYLANDGELENAQLIAAHESPRTTKLYDRTGDDITLDEIERIVI